MKGKKRAGERERVPAGTGVGPLLALGPSSVVAAERIRDKRQPPPLAIGENGDRSPLAIGAHGGRRRHLTVITVKGNPAGRKETVETVRRAVNNR
jgi:hypothetical protein